MRPFVSFVLIATLWLLAFSASPALVRADDESFEGDAAETTSGNEAESESEESEQPEVAAPVVKKSKGGRREKKAEGTKAPNRFEAEAVIKSQYRDDRGRRYDVDPD